MGFFSDMDNNEFTDEELGEVKPIPPKAKQQEKEIVKKRGKKADDITSDDDFEFSDEEMNEILGEDDEPSYDFDDDEYDEEFEQELEDDEEDIDDEEDDDMPFDDKDDEEEETFVPIKKAPVKQEKEKEEEKEVIPTPKPVVPVKPSVKKLVGTNETIISPDAVIDGNLTLTSPVTVLGKITGFLSAGDVTLEASGEVLGGIEGKAVSIEGKVDGDIKGENVTIGNCKIKGSIYADNSMTISEKATVVGGVTAGAGDVTILGKIKGDVESSGTVLLKTGAVVKGNITAVEVLIDKGTTFQGSIFKAGEIDDSLFE